LLPRLAASCRGVTKEFGEGNQRVRAVRDVSLDILLGEMTLLVGPSGCGKTTLISILAGLLEPTAGEVTALGVRLTGLPDSQKVAFRARQVGFVFQHSNLLPALTALENVAVPLVVAGHSRRSGLARAAAFLDAVGLGGRAGALPAQLSGGQQQRVAIARALVHEPRLVICDEPTASLDAHAGQNALALLHRLAVKPDRAVIVVTHDPRVFEFSDRIVRLNDGRVERVETQRAGGSRPQLERTIPLCGH
jgi:putative ABC transport system ATP-binding protein